MANKQTLIIKSGKYIKVKQKHLTAIIKPCKVGKNTYKVGKNTYKHGLKEVLKFKSNKVKNYTNYYYRNGGSYSEEVHSLWVNFSTLLQYGRADQTSNVILSYFIQSLD